MNAVAVCRCCCCCCCCFVVPPHSVRECERESLSLFDFISSTSRDILECCWPRVFAYFPLRVFFQLCLSDKISFFLILLPLFLTSTLFLAASLALRVNHGPFPVPGSLPGRARAAAASCVLSRPSPCARALSMSGVCIRCILSCRRRLATSLAGAVAGDFESPRRTA